MAHIPGHVGPTAPPTLPGSPGTRFNWGNLFNTALSAAGGLYGASQSRREAKRNRRFQEDMSSTAYQRAAKDLQAAGLNRILALGGPSTTPSGNMAAQQDPITPGIQTGISARLASATIANINARTRLTDAQRRVLGPAATVGEGIEEVVVTAKERLGEFSSAFGRSTAQLTPTIKQRQQALLKINIPENGHKTRIQHALTKTDQWVKAFIKKYRGAQPSKEQIQRIFDTHYEIRKGTN